MSSAIDICNRALSVTGTNDTIASLTEDIANARACNQHFKPACRALLRLAHWSFAKYQVAGALICAAPGTPENVNGVAPFPPQPWLYQYSYPDDCVDVRKIKSTSGFPNLYNQNKYDIQLVKDQAGNMIKVIVTNIPSALITYTYAATNPALWDDEFTEAYIFLFASYLVGALVGDKQLDQKLYNQANSMVVAARTVDANETPTNSEHIPDWIAVRGYSQEDDNPYYRTYQHVMALIPGNGGNGGGGGGDNGGNDGNSNNGGGDTMAANFDSIGNHGNSLAKAVTDIGLLNQVTLLVNVPNIVSANLTIPANINLMVAAEGVITVNTAVSLQINGYVLPMTLTNQMFNILGTGALSFSAVQDLVLPQHFGAQNGGTVDCTAAFQQAINSSTIVNVTHGWWLIAGQVTVPIGRKFVGQSNEATLMATSGEVEVTGGSIIRVTSTTLSPFLYQTGNSFTGLTFSYPNQLRTLATPIVYPATFAPYPGASTPLNDVTWDECQFINPYIAIDARISHSRFTFRNLRGFPLAFGIQDDGSADSDLFQGSIRFGACYWCQPTDAAVVWAAGHGVGLDLGYVYNFQGEDINMSNYSQGMQARLGTVTTSDGCSGTIANLSLTNNSNGMWAVKTGSDGIHITNIKTNANGNDILSGAATEADAFVSITGGQLMGAPATHVTWDCGRLRMVNVGLSEASIVTMTTGNGTGCVISLIGNRFIGSTRGQLNCSGGTLDNMILMGNFFSMAPAFAATPATVYRFVGNYNLADA